VEVTTTLLPADRAAWRAWLFENHATASEIWVISEDWPAGPAVTYLDLVEEALCFGWIDGAGKRISEDAVALRFSQRRRGGNWTELNKERARRLIHLGLMTEAGARTLPDLTLAPEPAVAPDIEAALRAAPGAWENFSAFPELYRRVRLGYLEEVRKLPAEFERRLRNFVARAAANKMYGNWNDGGRLG
jgi:uncharacterized protein YdeI (YjbR/CyaY-like superfamily)